MSSAVLFLEVGINWKKFLFRIDDLLLGERPGLGGYSEYSIADANVSFKIAPGLARDQASTVPLAAATAWLALLSKQCLNLDRSKASGTPVLVWGGSC